MADVRGLLEQFVEGFNEGDFERARRDYAEDAVQEEIGTGRTLTVEEGIASARAWKEAFPDARGTIETVIVDGTRGAAEVVWTGTNRGPFNGMSPTNRPVTMRAVVVLETDGSRIMRSRHCLDIAGMMAQLGVGQGAPTGERASGEPVGARA